MRSLTLPRTVIERAVVNTPAQPPFPPPPWTCPVVARIPEDQPFTVRPSVAKRALVVGGVVLLTMALLGCALGLASIGETDGLPLLIVWCVLAVLAGAGAAAQVYALASGGPALAVGPAGLWIRTRPSRGQAIWLPWEAIEVISRRRWGFETMLAVKPRDPRAVPNLGAFTAFDAMIPSAAFGTSLAATLNFADKPEQEILQAVTYFAANRVALR